MGMQAAWEEENPQSHLVQWSLFCHKYCIRQTPCSVHWKWACKESPCGHSFEWMAAGQGGVTCLSESQMMWLWHPLKSLSSAIQAWLWIWPFPRKSCWQSLSMFSQSTATPGAPALPGASVLEDPRGSVFLFVLPLVSSALSLHRTGGKDAKALQPPGLIRSYTKCGTAARGMMIKPATFWKLNTFFSAIFQLL